MLFICSFFPFFRYDMCLRESLLLNCCFLLCRGGVRPMDVVSVTTSPSPSSNNRTAAPRRLFSFLSVAWGFVSDVDIESERYICYAREACLKSGSYTLITLPFQISRTGLGSFYTGHSGAHSFSPILQGSPVVLASHKLYLVPGCHTASTTEDHLPKYHRRPGGPLPHTHPPHML